MSTNGNSQQRSQQRVSNLQTDRPQSQNQSDLPPEQLLEQLNQSEQQVSEITLQKEYLTGTCESQANHIRELTAKIQAMQTQINEKQNALDSQQTEADDSMRQIESL
ncbi:MAG: hypothetical protein ABFR90_11315, partial [Planctomycetota bacterium]